MLLTTITAGLMVALVLGWLMYLGTPSQRVGIVVLATISSVIIYQIVLEWPTNNETADTEATTENPTVSVTQILQHNKEKGFVSAKSCQECHPEQYSSWYDTYHRTMTQFATEESVIPNWNGVVLHNRSRDYTLFRDGEEFWVNTVNPAIEVQGFIRGDQTLDSLQETHVDRKIVLTTGSHHHQTYWMQNPNGTLIQFPWVYHINTNRWVYRIDSFLRPPTDKVTFNIWNVSCIDCHATGAEPRVNPHQKTMFSVGELGISCEACHGPAEEHIAWARSTSHSEGSDPYIVHPAKLNARHSSQVCGHCHSVSEIHDMQSWIATGDTYVPGEPETFEVIRTIIRKSEDVVDKNENFGTSVKTRFWPDGTIRTGGREFNGLIRSGCFLNGHGDHKLSCLSCHSMHDYQSPNKLISSRLDGQQMCIQCHSEKQYTTELEQHTHHPVDSIGSECLNCHMPRTSYALFSAIRSHRIQSPRLSDEHRGERPNACNLCHLDQTKAWTGEHLATWYSLKSGEISKDSQTFAAGLIWGLKGDAAQRALIADHLGRDETLSTIKSGWEVPLLAELMRDNYSAVRYIAYESLKRHQQYQKIEFQFDADEKERERVIKKVLQIWNARQQKSSHQLSSDHLERFLLKADGSIRNNEYRKLLNSQDQTPISIVE